MKLFKHLLIMALALTACVGITSCKDDDDDEDSKHPLTGYWVSEDGETFLYCHPNGCGFGGYLDENPPEIYDVFESYVITKDSELIIYWLDYDLTTDPDNQGKIIVDKNSISSGDGDCLFIKKGKDYPYTLNFQTNDKIANWWNEHTK